jgi:hypothetical protein
VNPAFLLVISDFCPHVVRHVQHQSGAVFMG